MVDSLCYLLLWTLLTSTFPKSDILRILCPIIFRSIFLCPQAGVKSKCISLTMFFSCYLLQPETVERRRLTRFQVGHEDNNLCWERHERDGFITPIDAHNHFRPFYGPAVPWDTYMDWMRSHGILLLQC